LVHDIRLKLSLSGKLFVHKVLKLLVSKGRITEITVAMMASWRHLAAP